MSGTCELPNQSWLVRTANGVFPLLWERKWLPPPRLDDEQLIEQAQRETGLSDFGDPWFRQPLRRLASALREEAQLNPLGRFAAHGQLAKLLRERLWAQHWFDTEPQILQQSLSPPVIVVGAMRSGTTRLHRLLAADYRFAHMRFFEAVCPAPHPLFAPGGPDPRPAIAGRILSAVHRLNPRTATIHPTGPMEPEEELGLLVASAWGMKHETQWRVPSYGRWSEEQDATPAYRHMARLLRLVSWARREMNPRPWVLKTPQHMLDLPALLRVFPGARLIFIHRDPVQVVGSACSLVWNQMIIHSDRVDSTWIGREWLRKTRLQIDRTQLTRAALDPARAIDVHYADMDHDWEQVMKSIYDFLDMDIAPALPAMRDYARAGTRRTRSRPHRYALSSFGLNEPAVREHFHHNVKDHDLDYGVREARFHFARQLPTGRKSAAW